jgi:hypothetical protein
LRHEIYRLARREGWSLDAIAAACGVTRRAVQWGLGRAESIRETVADAAIPAGAALDARRDRDLDRVPSVAP